MRTMHMVYTRGTSCGSMADSDWINRRLPILCDSPLAPEISSFEWATRFVCLLGARGVLGSSGRYFGRLSLQEESDGNFG